jgi:hypothetical protein
VRWGGARRIARLLGRGAAVSAGPAPLPHFQRDPEAVACSLSASAWDDDQASELRLDTLLLLADAGVSSGPQAGHQTPTLERDQHSGPPPGQLPHREGQAAVAHPDAASA